MQWNMEGMEFQFFFTVSTITKYSQTSQSDLLTVSTFDCLKNPAKLLTAKLSVYL